MSNNKSNTGTLPTLTDEELANASGGFGWSDVAKIAGAVALGPAGGPVGTYYGARAIYAHGRETGAKC